MLNTRWRKRKYKNLCNAFNEGRLVRWQKRLGWTGLGTQVVALVERMRWFVWGRYGTFMQYVNVL